MSLFTSPSQNATKKLKSISTRNNQKVKTIYLKLYTIDKYAIYNFALKYITKQKLSFSTKKIHEGGGCDNRDNTKKLFNFLSIVILYPLLKRTKVLKN